MSWNLSTIHVLRFPKGTQGRLVVLGTVKRRLHRRRLYVPSHLGGLCCAERMGWRELDLVKLAGVDYVAHQVQEAWAEQKKGDWVVQLGETDAIPRDLAVAEGAKQWLPKEAPHAVS